MSLSPTQKGRIAETIVGAAIMHASEGRLSPFMPIADDNGLDLILLDKWTGRTTPVQIKARFSIDIGNTCEFNVRVATCNKRYDCFLLAVYINPKTMAFEGIWLMPMATLRRIAPVSKGKYVLRASMAINAKDIAAPYRHYSMETIVSAFLKAPAMAEASFRRNQMVPVSRYKAEAQQTPF